MFMSDDAQICHRHGMLIGFEILSRRHSWWGFCPEKTPRRMEQSLSSLAFKGSITEAISEAKRQKKLFVVYTAGDNPESRQLETSTWIDPNVCGTLSKYCVLLHILEGSSEESNFSAIYPQRSAPCITAIGYNGVLLWQSEGFVSADVLASSLEKAWLSLHVQETTASFLTAALASGKKLPSETSETSSSEQVTTGTYVSSPAKDDNVPSLHAGDSSHSETIEDRNGYEDASKGQETDPKQDGVAFPEPSVPNVLDNGELESTSKIETGNTSRDPVQIDQNNPEVASSVPEKSLGFRDNHLGSSNEVSQEDISRASEVSYVSAEDIKEVEKDDASDSSAIKSNNVFLNIRLPDGSSLQVKFSVMDTLKMVKDYIDENTKSSFGSFTIAIPYPRKVFSDQDLDSTLSEMGLLNRQALVVVPQNQNNLRYGGASAQNQTYSSNDAGSFNASEGYWASAKRMLSYLNPFSYINRGASSPSASEESQSGIWQYSPNPSLQNTLTGGGRPSSIASSDQSMPTSGRNSNSQSRQQTSHFGGNIHTLKHDDDDSRFSDRKAFWNGNSTQYGGNNGDGK
ncbi:Ubiquitin regulatory protein UBXD2 [Handroanthus impetiginosus]|uniref:Ubiquitin regulatory protein UBXD2 n=1 Tax=Handroanthus impetiginosus TaxID=429701 RepID=A0A2G9HW25_9LAMI|nr:Ubiquitin regulatory protein UBXD2 [Handroanthus impetiginosus]